MAPKGFVSSEIKQGIIIIYGEFYDMKYIMIFILYNGDCFVKNNSMKYRGTYFAIYSKSINGYFYFLILRALIMILMAVNVNYRELVMTIAIMMGHDSWY